MNYSEQQKKAYNELKKRLVAYMSSVQSIYDNISAQAADIALKSEYDPESNEVFSFSDYPEQRTAIQKMQNDFVTDLSNLIDRGVTKEWQMSNEAQNLLVNSMVESAGVRLNNFYQKKFWQYNDDALNAFKKRKDKGMSLSTKIWQQSSELKTQLEDTISVAIQRGMSAVTLSKRISQYLQNYPKLKQDYGEKFGTAIRCRDCEYKSIRLARTEINMSYRMAEQERWRNLDFVLGYRIKLSKNHTCKGVINFYDICDELEGDYPKDFIWAGWHPSCRCYAIPILMSEDEFERYNRGEETTEKPITEMPKQFDEWLMRNADRIEKAQKRGTLPYFLKDNKQLISYINTTVKTQRNTFNSKHSDIDKLTSSENISDFVHKEQFAKMFGVQELRVEEQKTIAKVISDIETTYGKIIPIDILSYEMNNPASANGGHLNINSTLWGKDNIIDTINRKFNENAGDYIGFNKYALSVLQNKISQYSEYIKTGKNIEIYKQKISEFSEWIKKIEKTLNEGHKRYGVFLSKETMFRDTITHEMGHVIHDQILGTLNGDDFLNPKYLPKEKRIEALTLDRQLHSLFDKYKSNGTWLSEYGLTSHVEFLAECNVLYLYSRNTLPQDVKDWFDKLSEFAKK